MEALSPVKRGAKPAEPNPLAAENAQLPRDNNRLTRQLERAEAVITGRDQTSIAA